MFSNLQTSILDCGCSCFADVSFRFILEKKLADCLISSTDNNSLNFCFFSIDKFLGNSTVNCTFIYPLILVEGIGIPLLAKIFSSPLAIISVTGMTRVFPSIELIVNSNPDSASTSDIVFF